MHIPTPKSGVLHWHTRAIKWFFYVAMAFLAACVVVGWLEPTARPVTRIVMKALFPALVLVSCGWFFLYLRALRMLDQNELLICIHCDYPLKGLPREGNCPECGNHYTFDEVRKHWETTLTKPFEQRPFKPPSGSM